MVASEIYFNLDDMFANYVRLLQTNQTNQTDANNDDASPSDTLTDTLTDTEVIRNAFFLYGGIFAGLFVVFLLIRTRFPCVYSLKQFFPRFQVPVAADAFGHISWMWRVFEVEDKEICDQCGMDAITTIHILQLGAKLSLVGVFNSLFLAPTYALMGNTFAVTDQVKGVSLSNLAQGSNASIATTIAAYVFFICFMHWVDKEFEWFTLFRHGFLARRRVQNYSIFLSGLPPDMRTSRAITDYFRTCFSPDTVADVHVALVIPNLEKKVAQRDALVPKLEHATNVVTVTGKVPTHKNRLCGGDTVESVPFYTKAIEDLNAEIAQDVGRIEAIRKDREEGEKQDAEAGKSETQKWPVETASVTLLNEGDGDQQEPGSKLDLLVAGPAALSQTVLGSATKLKALIVGEDGAPRNAAFVSFSTLAAANLARQAVHNQEPWFCVPTEPPMPDYINWKNVGKPNTSKQIGELISLLLTVALCIFWTIPVTFVASLSNVEGLTELLPFLKDPVENNEWLSSALALLAPLLLVAFVSLLPHIILVIIKFEGLIETETMQHPSLYSKLAAFNILQTFFISTISGTLISKLQEFLDDPKSAIVMLSDALPAQSANFIAFILVQNLLPLGLELLRIVPTALNIARQIVSRMMGYNLTEKERNETFLGLRSLDDPQEYYFAQFLGSKIVLLQMVLYVYGSMAPITCYFTLLIFGLLSIGFRHQLIYVYPPANDSGGKLWIQFQRTSITCAIVSQIVLCTVLFLKEAYIAAVLLIPLIVSTILFDLYFKRRHYSITSFLPLGECAIVDQENESEDIHEWLKDAYLQPALKEKYAPLEDHPDDSGQREESIANDKTVIADEHKENGNNYMSNKEYQLALEQYNQAIKLSPSGENTYIYHSNRAAALCYLGEYDAAVDDCRKSIQLNPTYEKAHTRLGLSHYFQGDYQSAIDAYEKALELDPANKDSLKYMNKAKARLEAQSQNEPIEAESPSTWGIDSVCWAPVRKSDSFDLPTSNQD